MLAQSSRRCPNVDALWNRKGQSIVEISLITPLLLVVLYVPFDFGIALFTGHLTQNAVREAARIAVSDPDNDPFSNAAATNIATWARDQLPTLLDSPRSVTVRYYAPPGSSSSSCMRTVEVTAQGGYSFFWYRLVRLLGFPAPDPIQISRSTRMRYEFQPATNGGSGASIGFCTNIAHSGTVPAPGP
jgi:hypothetical protein